MSDKKKLPALKATSTVPATKKTALSKVDPLAAYLHEVKKYRLLTYEEEQSLLGELQETGSLEAAKKLVTANLRLVVKIAMEYRHSYHNLLDLIQEGNIGLMKAVSKYDSSKGSKLSVYASWWIKSYILKFILDNFRLVRIGTTKEQKKLFYNLLKEKDRLLKMGIEPQVKQISQNLGVSEKSVVEMDQRIGRAGSEMSIDAPLSSDGENSFSLQETLATEDPEMAEDLAQRQSLQILQEHLGEFMEGLKPRDRQVFQKRLLDEVPSSLQSIADQYGVSRERIRQIEVRLLEKLRVYMSEFMG